jgi:hypothetical protein
VGRVRRCESSSLRGARLEGPAPPRAEMRASACEACWSTAPIITAATGLRSAATNGRMMSACPIWSRGLTARLAAGVALMCGPIGNLLKNMPDTVRPPYDRGSSFGGASSPFNHPMTSSDFRGSKPLQQSKHWNVRLPLPPGGSAKVR